MPFLGFVTKILTGGLLDKLVEIYKLRQDGKISEAEFESRKAIAVQENAARIEQAWAETAKSAVTATQATLAASPILQRAWAATLFLQVFVLFWYQLGAPCFTVITGVRWPDPGVSLEWAYLLIAGMIGAGPLVLRR